MTTAQPMLFVRRFPLLALSIATLALCSCVSRTDKVLVPPFQLTSPYPQPVVLAVAPLNNESGTTAVDELRLADRLVEQLAEVYGISVVPLNRTLDAMQALRLPRVQSAADAHALARALGANAIVVGSVTAWDPYDPPRLGLNLALFGAGAALAAPGSAEIDPRALQSSSSDYRLTGAATSAPLATVSHHFDASNHAVLCDVKAYAQGRADPESALRWERYTKSMELYERFVSFRAVDLLLQSERNRVAAAGAGVQTASR